MLVPHFNLYVTFSCAHICLKLLVQDELEKFCENVSYLHIIRNEEAECFQIRMPAEAFRYGFGPIGERRFAKALAEHMNECFHPFAPLNGEEILVGNTATALNGAHPLSCAKSSY